MIENPNKPNICQWDSPEDKCTYCTETADNPGINPALLNGGICSAAQRLGSGHCSSQAMEHKLHSDVCMARQSKLLLIAMLPIYIYKNASIPPDSWFQMCPSSCLCSSTRDCNPSKTQAFIQSWSVRVSRKCSRSLKPDWNIPTAQHQSTAICNPLSHSLLSLMNSYSKTKK